jgi:pilus assembly protein CpaB
MRMIGLRNVLLIVLAIAAAGMTTLYARSWMMNERAAMMKNQPTKFIEATTVQILVADADLGAGTFVKPKHLKWLAWPEKSLADGYVQQGKRTVEDFQGAVVRSAIVKGQPISDGALVKPGDRGFLAAVLEVGKRAVSVPVDATSGIAGFVFPGDFVDVILSVRVSGEDEEGKAEQRYFSETLLTDIRVLAVDQKVENKNGKVSVAKTATLEVAPKQAEKVAVGLKMGSLSLSLHSLAREQDEFEKFAHSIGVASGSKPKKRSYTMDSEIYFMGRGLLKRQNADKITVLRGGKTEKVKY